MSALPEDPSTRSALAAHVGRLKHDLGKYVSMQQRWLGPDAAHDALAEALRADLLSTRRGPDGTVDAVAVWAEFRPALFGEAPLGDGSTVDLGTDPDLQRLDRAMHAVTEAVDALRGDGLDDDGVQSAHASALEVADACRSLARRLAAWSRRVDG